MSVTFFFHVICSVKRQETFSALVKLSNNDNVDFDYLALSFNRERVRNVITPALIKFSLLLPVCLLKFLKTAYKVYSTSGLLPCSLRIELYTALHFKLLLNTRVVL